MNKINESRLPLINRYYAAWIDRNTRVTQRQSIIQAYVAAIGVIFGLYYNTSIRIQTSDLGSIEIDAQLKDVSIFLMLGISIIGAVTSQLLSSNYNAANNLCNFMMMCEVLERESISELSTEYKGLSYNANEDKNHVDNKSNEVDGKSNELDLFYFSNYGNKEVHRFHETLRTRHQIFLKILIVGISILSVYVSLYRTSSLDFKIWKDIYGIASFSLYLILDSSIEWRMLRLIFIMLFHVIRFPAINIWRIANTSMVKIIPIWKNFYGKIEKRLRRIFE